MERPILIVKQSKIGWSTLRPKISPLIDDDKDVLIFLAIRKMRVIKALQKLKKRRGVGL
jgi:hypothetical protein